MENTDIGNRTKMAQVAEGMSKVNQAGQDILIRSREINVKYAFIVQLRSTTIEKSVVRLQTKW